MRTLAYKHRIAWFIANYYETGMEYLGLLKSMKDKDLDNVKWYDETIQIPKELPKNEFKELDRYCKKWDKFLIQNNINQSS